ncbi:exocyst complex component SEC5A-like [Wolffia australiana]
MSSDRDDLDEDELLQIALKEQAQRDLNYTKRPSGGRPVVNLVQPPPPPPFMANSDQRRSKPPPRPQKGRLEPEDDSKVEFLSISSGDDDESGDLGPPTRNRRVSGGKKAGRSDVGSGDLWDGDEPANWKRVDEAELARRVREMRETRVTAVIPILEKKPSTLGRKVLANLQSLPRGIEALDPLGLGIIDSRKLTLITDDSESTPVKVKGDRDSLDPRLREKIMFYSEGFDARLFLSRVHKDTSSADLESGALTLKTDLRGRTQQKKQLVKENFDCYVSCKSTIDDIELKLRRIEEDPDGSGTKNLCKSMESITLLANRAFQPLFERQGQAEKIRSVQGMLQRFRTLFNLPSTIRGNISKGEYDLAVREYRKAKSIVLPSHVGILKRVLEEVEKVMQEFKTMLYRSMEDPLLDLAELENTVRLLLELEPGSDPVWHFLNIQNRRIRVLLDRCGSDHERQMERLRKEIKEKVQSDMRWKELQRSSAKSNGDVLSPSSVTVDLADERFDELREGYIHKLTSIIIHHLPEFWKLALSIFSGKFAKVSVGSALDQETSEKATLYKAEDKSGQIKYSNHAFEEVSVMFLGTQSLYESKVLTTFRDFQGSNVFLPYMINAIKEVSKACQSMEVKESVPQDAVKSLRSLHFEMAKIYVSRLCSWMRSTTEELSKNETWIPLSVLERNRSSYTISSLPLAFRDIAVSAMDQISGMIQILSSEAEKSHELFSQVQDTQESVRIAFLNCFLDFAGYLEQIGGELSSSELPKETSSIEPEIHDRGSVSDPFKKLLIVLSNVGYCKEELCGELYTKYKHIWIQTRENDEHYSDVRDLVMSFSALEEKILEYYTYAKANLIRDAALDYLLDSGVRWGGATAVKGIRDATLDLLSSLVSVHAEVCWGAKPLLGKTLGILVEGLFDTFLNAFHENRGSDLKSLDANAFCQLMLELDFFETILQAYITPEADEALKSLQALLLETAAESATEAMENPGHHRRPTRGSEDAIADDKLSTSSPDDLLALAQQVSGDRLVGELERARLNISCFMKPSPLPNEPPSPLLKPANSFSPRRAVSPAAAPTRQRRR